MYHTLLIKDTASTVSGESFIYKIFPSIFLSSKSYQKKELEAAVSGGGEAKEINSILQTKEKAISNFYHCLFLKDHNQ